MADYIQIKTSVIRWACDRIGFLYSELSASNDFKALAKETEGVVSLTLKQAEKLAKVLRYPFVYLLLDSPVTDIDKLPIADFRSCEGKSVKPNINLKEQIEYCQNQQDWFSDYVNTCDLDVFKYNGKFSLHDDPQDAGLKLKKFFKISYRLNLNADDYLERLKCIFENSGILVTSSKVLKNTQHRLSLSDFRGFALFDDNAPLIFINGNDSTSAQIFTLCHELGHIVLGQSGVSDVVKNNTIKIETWCNEFAATILMPKKDVIDTFYQHINISQFLADATKIFHVNGIALLHRIYNLNLIDKDTLHKEWVKAEATYQDELKTLQSSSERSNFSYYKTVYSRLSRLLLQSLISSTSVGNTTFRDATYLLGLKSVSSFDRLVKTSIEANA